LATLCLNKEINIKLLDIIGIELPKLALPMPDFPPPAALKPEKLFFSPYIFFAKLSLLFCLSIYLIFNAVIN